ncbi:MAG TPA: SdrD B-like domain-containing protein, partial [Saprospiraceae bacterium]|nr:SdrD B-like domain-containing protein [Saprospiraceae bacterium]
MSVELFSQDPCTLPLGTAPSLTCPLVARFNIGDGVGSCDIDNDVPGEKYNCASTLSQLSRAVGNTTCECSDKAACVGEWDTSESTNWSQNREVYFTISFDPTKSVSFDKLLIQTVTGPDLGGNDQNLNYSRKLSVRVFRDGSQIFAQSNITLSTTQWAYSSINLGSLTNLPGGSTYKIGIVAYDLASTTNGMAAIEFRDIQLSACCASTCAVSGGTLNGDQTICSGGDPTAFTINSSASGNGTLTYQWQKNTSGCSSTFSNISGATSVTYDAPSGLTQTTYYRRVTTNSFNGSNCTSNSNCITVTVDPSTSCNNCNTTLITYDGNCNDGPDTFSPSNMASCITNASELYPSAGSSYASCSNGIVCHSAINGDLRFNFTANGIVKISQLKGDFLFPISSGAGGGSNSSSCPNSFSFKLEFRINGSLSQTINATIAKGVLSTLTFNLSPNITLNSGQVMEVRIIGLPTSSSCDLFELAGLNLYGCCNPCTVDPGSVGSDQSICYGGNPSAFTSVSNASGSGTLSYQWQRSTSGCSSGWTDISGATSALYDVPSGLTQTTYYRRRVRNTVGTVTCDQFSNCLTVTVNPQLTINMPDLDLCPGPNVTVTASAFGGTPNYTYTWSSGLGTGSSKSIPTTNATYTVTVTDSKNCTAVDPFTVTVGSITATATNDGPLTCSKTSVVLTANPATGVTYLWSGGGTSRTKTVTAAGTYTVTVSDVNMCTAVATTTVSSNTTPPAATASNDGPLSCTKTSVTLTATGGGTYAWSGGGTAATKSVSAAGTYTVTVTASNGCTAVAATTVSGDTSVPSVTATNDGPLTCTKTNVTLTANPATGVTYAWSGGGTARTKSVTSAGTYTVTVTNNSNGCTAVATTTVTGDTSVPTATANNDGPLTCSKTSVTLTATGGGTYAWSGGGTGATKVVTTAGTYTVTVTSANGCTASSMTTVTQNIVPPSALASNDGPLTCSKTSVLLTANPATGVTYVWSNGGQTTRQKTVTLPGTYSVTITDNLNGCTAVATTTVSQNTVVPNASAENLGGPLTCIDNSVTIQAFPNDATYTYNWNGPSGYSSTSRTNTVGIAGTYTVTVTNTVSNCTSTATTTVTQNVTPPTVTVNNDGPLTCSKTSVTMTALPGTGLTYSWSGGGTGQTKVVTVAGSYTVTVTDIVNGCTAVNSTTVTQNTTVTPATASNDGPLTCSKTSVTLTASPTTGVSYAWSGGGTSQTKVVTVPGLYTLTVTTISNGCTSTATTNVTQDIIAPIASADNVGGPLTCIDNSVTVRAFPNIATYSYEWSGPNSYYGTSRTQDVSVSGNYVVTVTNTINGCKSSASTAVLQDVSVPTANAGGNKTICNGTSTTLTATGNGSYLWSNNMTTASITVTPVTTTTYTITVTGSNGCTNTASALVTVTPLPASGLSGPTEVCMDEYGVFSASPAVSGATYSWTFDGGTSLDGDANDPTESVKWAPSYANTTRTVTLVVTKDNCSSTYTKAVIVKQGAYLNTQASYPVCQGGTVQIGPNPNDPAQVTPGSSFQWTPNLFLNNNTVARPLSTPPFDMQYTLTATVNGCATSMQITVDVNVNLNPIADAGADKVICLSESTTIGGTPTSTPPPTGGATINGVLWSVPPSSTITSTLNNPLVSPTLNTQYRVVVVASNGCTDTDFVNITVNPKQKIGNYTWIDSNKDGCQTTGELGLNGVTVSLYTSTGTLVTTATTSNNPTNGLAGYYQFEVCPGSYYVNFGQPTGYVFTGKNICGDVPSNSDANTTNGNVDPFTIVSGQDNFTIDAGFIPVGNIRGNVTADTNNDNVG